MIPYVEIIQKETLKKVYLVEPIECWFELSYFDFGEFEVYCAATPNNLAYLKKGNYVKLPNKPYIWVIESLNYTYVEGVPMLDAKGYGAKWLLKKRVIQAPIELPPFIALACEQLVYNNLGAGASENRQIANFSVYTSGITVEISEKDPTLTNTQAVRGNLMEYVNNLLTSYNLGSIVIYENETLLYKVIQGQDVSEAVRFSQSLDNLISSSYLSDDSNLATNALVVSTVNNVDYMETYDTGATGVDRAEIYINSNISTEYTPEGATEPVKLDLSDPDDLALYLSWLKQEGNTQLTNYLEKNEVSSTLDLMNSNYEFENEYFIGDLVGIIDEYFNYNTKARIVKLTYKQDSGGYGEEAAYQI